jgi:hypothetical protein
VFSLAQHVKLGLRVTSVYFQFWLLYSQRS